MPGRLKSVVGTAYGKWKYAPRIDVEDAGQLLTLGSEYGGWTFEPSADLEESKIVSCGFGEDGSFDVEFATRFRATVIVVDPTPRAVNHFEAIQQRLGEPSQQSYVDGGKQPATAYDLRGIRPGSLVMERMALWTENTTLKFFAPRNPEHVSHSIVNYQNEYRSDSPSIEVPTITLPELLEKYQITSLPLLKIDIEGAEVKVIEDMLQRGLRPRQLMVEFDEMNFPSQRSKDNAEAMDRQLREAGYACRYFDHKANFLYVHKSER